MKRKNVAAASLGLSIQMIVALGGMGAAPLAIATAMATASPAQATTLSNWAFDPATRQLQVVLPNGVTPRYFLLAEPTRIVLDIPNTQVGNVPIQQSYSGVISSIRIAQFDNRSTRIVMQLAPNTVLDPQQAQLDQVAGETETRWVLQPLLDSTAPSAVPNGIPIAAQMADPVSATAAPAPTMQFSEEDPGTPLAEATQNSLLTSAEELSRLDPDATPNALPSGSADNATGDSPTVSVPPLASAETATPTPPSVTVPPLDSGSPSAEATETETATAADHTLSEGEPSDLAITPEDAASSISIAVEPVGPELANVAEAAPTMPPFLVGTNLEGTNLDGATPAPFPSDTPAVAPSPEPVIPESAASTAAPDAIASSVAEENGLDLPEPSAPATETSPTPGAYAPLESDSTEDESVAGRDPASSTATPTTSPSSEAVAVAPLPNLAEPTPTSSTSNANTSASSAVNDSPAVATPNTTPASSTDEAVPNSPPFLSQNNNNAEPTTSDPAQVTTPPPTNPTADAAPTIPFGQPLPTTNSSDPQLRSLNPGANAPLTDAWLTTGTTLPLTYTHSQPLVVTGADPLQEVLVLSQDVRNNQTGNVVLPRGTLVIGRFETDGTNRTFVTQAVSLRGQNIPISAKSDAIIGSPEVADNALLRNSGIGAAALTILTGFTGVGLIGGAALGAATTYAVSPQTVVIEPNQVIQVTLIEDINVGANL